MLASTRGAESRFVTEGEADELRRLWRTPEWSADGRFVVHGKTESLVVSPAEGGEARRIATPGTGENSSATWSPNGRWIAFTGFQDVTHPETDLYVVRADGSGLRQLRSYSHDPQWSHDGSLIAFRFDETDIHVGESIGVIRPDGSGLRFLTKQHEGPDHRSANQASWVDARTLVFVSYQQRQGPRKVVDIHTIRSDGRGERRVTYQCHLGSRGDDRISGSNPSQTRSVRLRVVTSCRSGPRGRRASRRAQATTASAPSTECAMPLRRGPRSRHRRRRPQR